MPTMASLNCDADNTNELNPKEKQEKYTQFELVEHLASVAFSKPEVKVICSKHSGSIVASDGPIVPLTDIERAKARGLFQDAANPQELIPPEQSMRQQSTDKGKLGEEQSLKELQPQASGEAMLEIPQSLVVKREELPKLLIQYGFTAYDDAQFRSTIMRLHKGSDELNEKDFIDFVQYYQAPPYHYGQRLRRYAGRGEINEVIELILRGCDPNTGDAEGLTALHYSCEFNRSEVIKKLHSLCRGKLLLDARDKYGWTPLHCAAHHGNVKCVSLLLELGAKHSMRDAVGKTPLHFAAAQCREEICYILLEAGASASATDKHDMTPGIKESLGQYMYLFMYFYGEVIFFIFC
jgi:hypothetical protein